MTATLLALALLAGALGLPESPPAAATAFVDAIEAGDAAAARTPLAPAVRLVDARGDDTPPTLEALGAYVRGCERMEIAWRVIDDMPGHGDVALRYECPSRGAAHLFIRASEAQVLLVRWGPPAEGDEER